MGIVTNEQRAVDSDCTCYKLPDGELMCYSPGVVGTLSDAQEIEFCETKDIKPASKEMKKRHGEFTKVINKAVKRYKGEGIGTWGGLLEEEFQKVKKTQPTDVVIVEPAPKKKKARKKKTPPKKEKKPAKEPEAEEEEIPEEVEPPSLLFEKFLEEDRGDTVFERAIYYRRLMSVAESEENFESLEGMMTSDPTFTEQQRDVMLNELTLKRGI